MGTTIAEYYKNKLGYSRKLLLLFDEECKKMDENLNHEKTYQFKIAWGFQTR